MWSFNIYVRELGVYIPFDPLQFLDTIINGKIGYTACLNMAACKK